VLFRLVPLFALASVLLSTGCANPSAQPPGASDTLLVMLRVDDVFMHDTDIQPQEIDTFLAVAERFGAKVELSVIPQRLTAANNADGRMAASLRRYVARGHDVSQHGWNHRNARTGDTGSEFYDPATQTWSAPDTLLAHLGRGKRVLEETTGVDVIRYVSPGRDPQGAPENLAAVRAHGYRWLTHDSLRTPTFTDSLRYIPSGTDYTWALADSIYDVTLDGAKHDVRQAIARGDGFFIAIFHDHFTRHAWNDGITARWLGDLLAWIEEQPVAVRYVTTRDLEADRADSAALSAAH
jgi:peptidoglycan/xylan/chitin deacetylase (PgdA/CDA1 family)